MITIMMTMITMKLPALITNVLPLHEEEDEDKDLECHDNDQTMKT